MASIRDRSHRAARSYDSAATRRGHIWLAVMTALLLLPACGSREPVHARNNSANNLKQVGLAVLQYFSTEGQWPAAVKQDDAGNPLLSWRVTILPYLDQQALYEQFHQDESWNGPHNERLIASEPALYLAPQSAPDKSGQTEILGIVGPETILSPEGGVRSADLKDSTSTTIVAVELAGSGIAWSEPRDITIDEFIDAIQRKSSASGLRQQYAGGAYCLFADGAVRFISGETPPETLRAMCTRAGGETVDLPSN